MKPHLPVIIDISHACWPQGHPLTACAVSMAAGADGIMAEVHPNPQFALSDATTVESWKNSYVFMEGLKRIIVCMHPMPIIK